MNFASIEHLRTFLSEPHGSKLKFAEKLFIVLNFTKQNPHLIRITGACWLDDGTRFITNSQIFGNLINLKPNSVNANFRMHSFTIIETPLASIVKHFPLIINPKNFKLRANLKYHFSVSSTHQEVLSIPCDSPHIVTPLKTHSGPPPENLFPTFLKQFIGPNRKEMMLHIELLYTKLNRSSEWKEKFFKLAIQEWREIAGDELSIDVTQLLQNVYGDIYSQESTNLSFLLNIQLESSVTETSIGFDSYVNFVIQYGFLKHGPNIIDTITKHDNQQTPNNSHSIPSFKNWFKPSFNNRVALLFLSDKPTYSWLLRPSSQKGNFSIQLKTKDEVITSYIRFDVFETNKRFSIEISDGRTIATFSLEELLFHHLHLSQGTIEQVILPSLKKNVESMVSQQNIKRNFLF